MMFNSKWIPLLVLGSLLAVGPAAFAQGGKAFLKEGDALRKQERLEEALERYDLAVRVDPKLIKAFQARSEVYELLGRQADCAADRRRMSELDPGDADLGALAARSYLLIDSFAVARDLSEKALHVDRKQMDALQTRVRACLALGDLDCATSASDAALALKATTDTYFLHGLVRHAMRDYKTAEFDMEKVLSWNHLYEPAYVAYAEVQLALYEQYSGGTMRMRTVEKAIEKCTRALELNPQSTDALFTRSKALALQMEYARAIDDISRCIALGRTDRAVYFQRALYYKGFGQHQNAINDLNKVLLDDPGDTEALLFRASEREANLEMEGALKDLDAVQRLFEEKGEVDATTRHDLEESRARIAERIFEMNREADPPSITVMEPTRRGEEYQVSATISQVKVSGYVRDKSLIRSITVNGKEAEFTEDEKDPQFVVVVPLGIEEEEIVVQAMDVYENMGSYILTITRSEGTPPEVAITLPKLEEDGRTLSIFTGVNDVFIEGQVTDSSLIRLITVNGVNASYPPDRLNPDFGIKLDVKERDKIVVRAEDLHGNAVERSWDLVRKEIPVVVQVPAAAETTAVAVRKPGTPAAPKPSTVTWVVHIENGNYREFPALNPSVADKAKMQKAFANYNVQRTISKKNLTKEQMERFFNVELRDQVRSGKVNTILVWYTGHGKTVGGKAYWVPVDGHKDNIYSYFNYGSLKAQMQNYSESVNSTVVVSDAAAGDASFYELTR